MRQTPFSRTLGLEAGSADSDDVCVALMRRPGNPKKRVDVQELNGRLFVKAYAGRYQILIALPDNVRMERS